MFIINCKNYDEISGEKIIKLAKISQRISKKHKIPIAIAPPHHLIPLITKFNVIVLAQHLDDKKVGGTTGFMIPEIVKKSKNISLSYPPLFFRDRIQKISVGMIFGALRVF